MHIFAHICTLVNPSSEINYIHYQCVADLRLQPTAISHKNQAWCAILVSSLTHKGNLNSQMLMTLDGIAVSRSTDLLDREVRDTFLIQDHMLSLSDSSQSRCFRFHRKLGNILTFPPSLSPSFSMIKGNLHTKSSLTTSNTRHYITPLLLDPDCT